jgi:hypothetical protein
VLDVIAKARAVLAELRHGADAPADAQIPSLERGVQGLLLEVRGAQAGTGVGEQAGRQRGGGQPGQVRRQPAQQQDQGQRRREQQRVVAGRPEFGLLQLQREAADPAEQGRRQQARTLAARDV